MNTIARCIGALRSNIKKSILLVILAITVVFLVENQSVRRNLSYYWALYKETEPFKIEDEKIRFCIVSPTYNSKKMTVESIKSVLRQKYSNWHLHVTDDKSPDGTYEYVSDFIRKENIGDKVSIVKNEVNVGAMANIYNSIHKNCADDDVVVMLDGDDMLFGKYVFHKLFKAYNDNDIWLSFGRYVNLSHKGKSDGSFYKPEVIRKNEFRAIHHKFSHLRSFRAWLFKKIKLEDLKDRGEFYRLSHDIIIYSLMSEMTPIEKIKMLPAVMYVYNDVRPDNDFKIYSLTQLTTHRKLIFKPRYSKIKDRNDPVVYMPPVKLVAYDLACYLLIDPEYVDPSTKGACISASRCGY